MISLAELKISPQEKYLEIHMADNGVSINGIVVIGRQASSRLLILRLLLEQYWQDFEVAKPLAQHTFLNINRPLSKLYSVIKLLRRSGAQILMYLKYIAVFRSVYSLHFICRSEFGKKSNASCYPSTTILNELAHL
jgi:hypothetical protein